MRLIASEADSPQPPPPPSNELVLEVKVGVLCGRQLGTSEGLGPVIDSFYPTGVSSPGKEECWLAKMAPTVFETTVHTHNMVQSIGLAVIIHSSNNSI